MTKLLDQSTVPNYDGLDFWSAATASLAAIAGTAGHQPATTATQIIKILNGNPHVQGMSYPATDRNGFFPGDAADFTDAIYQAGWRKTWAEAGYYWRATHLASGDVIEYCEGDVHDITHRGA